jgi:CRP/FNR family transcriptional regulator
MDQITKECIDCFFKTRLCKGLSSEEFSSIFESTTQNTYKKGEVIFKQGIKTNYLVFLTHGLVKFVYDNNGKELIVTIDKAQTLLGLANILNEDVNLFSIIAVEESRGCIIDINKFKLQILNNRQFMLEIMGISTQMFRKSIFNFISIAHKQSNGRIADILIYLSEDIYKSNSFILSLSRQELADFAGCSKELIIHTLQNFSSEKIINVSGKKLEITDAGRLRMISKNG